MKNSFGDFLKQNFDKLLLSGLFLITLGLCVHSVRALIYFADVQRIAQLTSMVGRSLSSRSGDNNGNGNGAPTLIPKEEGKST